jgi:beta-lactamase class D
MLTEQDDPGVLIYGKTGMGKAHGIVVDAWFTGFAEREDRMVYFCIWLVFTKDYRHAGCFFFAFIKAGGTESGGI